MFKALAQENSEIRYKGFRSSSFPDLMIVGDSLRPLRAWR